MFFESVELRFFRNYSHVRLEFHKGLNAFLGENGQGKSNLLEALYFLMRGHSFRALEKDSLLQRENGRTQPASVVKAHVVKDELHNEVSLRIQDHRKKIELNNKSISRSNLWQYFPCVIFSPESLSSVKGGPEQRRELVDELLLLLSPKASQLIGDYQKVLKSRNRVLKNMKLGEVTFDQGLQLLESLNPIFLNVAAKLTAERILALRNIAPDLSETLKKVLNKNVDISVDYLMSSERANAFDQSEIHDALRLRILQLQKAEIETGTSLVGPHKHDIRFMIDAHDSRYYCSQGQQRALILSFKMAQIMYHGKVHREQPILLLDDVLSELDAERRANLIEFLKGINSQIFLTTTDLSFPEHFLAKDMAVHRIAGGKIQRLEEVNECHQVRSP